MNIKVPVSWLREYLKTDAAAKTIANWLTLCGPSVEYIEKYGQDYIFDVEVTSNRPDAFSIFGLAREANAILANNNQKSQLAPPKGLDTSLEPDTPQTLPLEVLIRDKSLCHRFTAVVIDNVKIKPSPAIIKNRLQATGIRPINNIVDIANYIMLELGQPMHTFDWDKILGAKMILRQSRKGERIKTLDGQTRKLPAGTIVIEDEKRLIDLCGIMGGANSQITKRTKRVVMFIQSYNRGRIRRTTQALAFRTEAAARFEKGLDPEGILPALSRSIYLAKLTAGAKIASELTDIYQKPPHPAPITLNLSKLYSYLGITISLPKAVKILDSLGFQTSSTNQAITATPPSWRTADMAMPQDLIEEIARIAGFHNLPSRLPQGQIPQGSKDSILTQAIELKKALKFLGLTEIISYSIISKELLDLAHIKESQTIELENPLTAEWQFMRPTIIPSLVGVIAQNQNLKNNLKLFEVARTYIPPLSSSQMRGSDLPKQDLMLIIVLQNCNFYQIKGLVENVFEILRREPKFTKLTNTPGVGFDSPGVSLFDKPQSAQIKIGETQVGTLGILNQSIADHFDIDGPIAAAEINLTTIYQLPTTQLSYHPIPKYPPFIEDISAIFDQKTPVAAIISKVKRVGEPLVKNIAIIDVFQDKKIGLGKKSITLRLTYQRPNRTLSQEEVTQMRERIVNTLTHTFHAQIRR